MGVTVPTGFGRRQRGHDAREGASLATNSENRKSLWDIEAVAGRLGVPVRHVRRLVAERRIPYIKWGHLIRFDPADVEAWLDGARRPPQAG
jgi:excisionase family DNA binding protein